MKNGQEGHRARLRERFLRVGFSGFADYEILELLLTLCIPRNDVKAPAKALMEKFKSLRAVLDAPAEELSLVTGIGKVAPVALRIIREMASLYLLQDAEGRRILNNSEKLEAFWQSRLSSLSFEVFEVAYLDSRYQLLREGVERLEVGTVDRTVVYPRKVMESALRRSASAIVLAHNHPAGTASPSAHDISLTQGLIQAAKTLNIEVIDHVIIAAKEVFSFRRKGLIQ